MTTEGANTEPEGEGALADILARATRRLAAAGIEAPAREARLLLAHVLGTSADELRRLPRAAAVSAPGFASLLRRRAEAREPLAFLLGTRGFWTLDLAVSPATLIPRADTETLIEAALAARPDRAAVRRILDLGTGTGAILLAALSEYGAAEGLGVDVVEAAAHLARANAAAVGLSARALFVCGDWAAALAARFDLVFSNPPYIESGALAGLMPEVARHEPHSALDGGADGLAAYRAILAALPALLAPAGLAILEVGAGQSEEVRRLGHAAGLDWAATRADLAGTARAVVFTARPQGAA